MNAAEFQAAPAPRRTSLDDFIRANTTPVTPTFAKSVRWEREAVMAAAAQGDAARFGGVA